jgi:hypothetical protein
LTPTSRSHRLLRANRNTLLTATTTADRASTYQRLRQGPLLGSLFESLATLSIRVYAQPLGSQVSHLRTHSGDHEVDLIVEAPDGRVIVTTGTYAYRRPDGVAVVPLALLGP